MLEELIKYIEERFEQVARRVVREELSKLIGPGNHHEDDEILDVKAAATFVKLSVSRVYTIVNKGQMPTLTPRGSGKLRFSKQALREWMMAPKLNNTIFSDKTIGLKPPTRRTKSNKTKPKK
jgi:predicted DNA-binding transcriptional regulator AlpA